MVRKNPKSRFAMNKEDIIEYLALHKKEFRENLYPKLEQSGEKTERLIKLEQVFIDLYATSNGIVPKDDKPEKKFVELITHRGNNVSTPGMPDGASLNSVIFSSKVCGA